MFTIIIATHDRPLLLRRTLQSLIAQTCQAFQVIVVSDSASYLPPYEELQRLQGRYVFVIRGGRPGPGPSRNMGLALAESDYVIFLDDDDTFEPDHLQSLADRIGTSRPELIYTNFTAKDEDRSQSPPTLLRSTPICLGEVKYDSLFIRNRIPNSCVVYRRDLVANIRYDAELVLFEDWDFLLACFKKKRQLTYLPVYSVSLHKDKGPSRGVMHRGNEDDPRTVDVMLAIFKRHRAPHPEIRRARQDMFAANGLPLPIDRF